jgi:hypothetical protein
VKKVYSRKRYQLDLCTYQGILKGCNIKKCVALCAARLRRDVKSTRSSSMQYIGICIIQVCAQVLGNVRLGVK